MGSVPSLGPVGQRCGEDERRPVVLGVPSLREQELLPWLSRSRQLAEKTGLSHRMPPRVGKEASTLDKPFCPLGVSLKMTLAAATREP